MTDNFIAEMESARLNIFAKERLTAVSKSMYGMEQEIKLCLVALLTRGHVLLEGNPGLGKTALVRALGQELELTYGRIQFTPDLMPSDITGTEMPEKSADVWTYPFRPGPIFKTLLLADEINRASPKTQSAMLEAMAERQVTVLGTTHALPVFFTVLATENPIDQEGTYPLPEAQSDRFLFKVNLNSPSIATIHEIIQKDAGEIDINRPEFQLRRHLEETNDLTNQKKQDDAQRDQEKDLYTQSTLLKFYRAIRKDPLINKETVALQQGNLSVVNHIGAIYMVSNGRIESIMNSRFFTSDQKSWMKTHCERFQYGISPRATTALALALKAWSLMFPASGASGTPDAATMAQVAPPILRHRIKLKESWDQDNSTGEKFLKEFLLQTAPDGVYKKALENELYPTSPAPRKL